VIGLDIIPRGVILKEKDLAQAQGGNIDIPGPIFIGLEMIWLQPNSKI
jgi:hypothetical protein